MRLTIGHDGGGEYSLNTGKVRNLIVEQAADKPTVRLLDEEWSQLLVSQVDVSPVT